MTNYPEQPDSIARSRMEEYFVEFLDYYSNNTSTCNIHFALSELLELADRQWHTYEELDEKVVEQIEKFIRSVIIFEDEGIMDYILNVIPRLGMENLFEYILHNKNKIHNKAVLDNICLFEMEYGIKDSSE